MRMDKLTIKSQEALQEAQSQASSRGHGEITPAHLLRALLGQPEGSTIPVLEKLGVAIDPLAAQVEELLSALTNLGYPPAQARRVVEAALEEAPAGSGLEDLIRVALRRLAP